MPSIASASIVLLIQKLRSIHARVSASSVARRTGATTGVNALGDLQLKLCDVLTRFLAKTCAEVREIDEAEALLDVSKVSRAAELLSRLTRFTGSEDAVGPPQGTVLPFTDLVRSVAPNAAVIVRCQSAYEYESYFEIRKILEDAVPTELVRETFLGFPQGIYVLNIPVVEARNILHHCLLGHEVGHIAFLRNKLEGIPTDLLNTDPARSEFDSAFSEYEAEQGGLEIDLFRTWVSKIISNWFKELASDLFAANIMGPCIFFALRDFALPLFPLDFTPGDPSVALEYPPLCRRFKLMLETIMPFLKREGVNSTEPVNHGQILDELRADAEEWKTTASELGVKLPQPYRFVGRVVDECLTRVQDDISASRPRYFYDPSTFREEVFDLYERIDEDILPNELLLPGEGPKIGRPPHWQSILNAAWIYYLLSPKERFGVFKDWSKKSEGGSALGPSRGTTEKMMELRYERLMEFNDFISRAVEVSIFHDSFQKNKAQWGDLFSDPGKRRHTG